MEYRKIARVIKNSQQNNSETVTNGNDGEIPKERHLHIFYFISNSVFGFKLEFLGGFLIFSLKVAYKLLSIISASHVFYEYTLYTSLSVMIV